jgi:hypothetical protein
LGGAGRGGETGFWLVADWIVSYLRESNAIACALEYKNIVFSFHMSAKYIGLHVIWTSAP